MTGFLFVPESCAFSDKKSLAWATNWKTEHKWRVRSSRHVVNVPDGWYPCNVFLERICGEAQISWHKEVSWGTKISLGETFYRKSFSGETLRGRVGILYRNTYVVVDFTKFAAFRLLLSRAKHDVRQSRDDFASIRLTSQIYRISLSTEYCDRLACCATRQCGLLGLSGFISPFHKVR